LISAKNFVPVTWASGIDLKTGRPIENPGIRYDVTGKSVPQLPGALGGHNWQSMAFNPKTGLAYIPAHEVGMVYTGLPEKDFRLIPGYWNLGIFPSDMPNVKGYLLAWDPANQKEVWRANYLGPWNGGVLTTAGNLVVQGNATGALAAYRADTGENVWSTSTQSPVIAAPITYQVDGEQYIAVLAGWGGIYPLIQGQQAAQSGNTRNISRVLVFKIGGAVSPQGGAVSLPPVAPLWQAMSPTPPDTADAATLKTAFELFAQFCEVCHGIAAVGGGVVPDLRKSVFLPVDAFYDIVLDGILGFNGMAPFGAVLDRPAVTAIRAYIIQQANKDKTAAGEHEPRQPDVNHGAIIAAQGSGAGGPACALCHAFNGGSDGSGAFPRIAGQSAFYLSQQLRAFSSGDRLNAVMSPIAKALSEDDISDVTAYYASAVAPFLPLANTTNAALLAQGERLAKIGNEAKGVPACASCHAADGAGESPTIPYLGGQYGHYISFELEMWQRGFRSDWSDRNLAPNLDHALAWQAEEITDMAGIALHRGEQCLLPRW
jgi:cytochrome c553